jgi:hypothetical protein
MKSKPKQESDQPQVEISCPHCGGASQWNLLQTLNQCTYCGSVLSWPYPEGEPDYLVAETTIHKPQDLIEVLAMYDAMREASRRRGNMRPGKSDYDPEIYFELGAGFTDTEVYEIKRERIHLFRLIKSFPMYVPYQLICSLLSFHVLGRIAGDHKVFQSLFFLSEEILPGYTADWNFRDKGLQLSKQRLKPLSSDKWTGSFLATGSMTSEIEKLTRQWTGQKKIFEAEIQPICFQGKALESHRWWVYRPYYFLHAETPSGNQWFLVDGQFGTIAGTPTFNEVTKLTRGGWKKLDLHSVRMCNVQVIPFRCPNCGWDVKLKKGSFQICENCTRALVVDGNGLKIMPYGILRSESLAWWPNHRGPKVWLPFWRVELSMLFEKKKYEDLSSVIKVLLPAVKQMPEQKQLYIPAFECWPIAKYDRWSFEFGSCLSEIKDTPAESTLHELSSRNDVVVPPVVSKELIPSLFPQIVPYFASSAIQARLNTMLINRLGQMHVLIKNQQLVFVPTPLLEARGSESRLQGPKQSIEWMPLREGRWPPVLQRTVRRWKALGAEKKERAPKSRSKWLTSPFNRNY